MAGTSGTSAIPGKIVKEIVIPAREYLGLEVKKGQVLRVIDIEGQQCADLAVFNLHNPDERLSCSVTRTLNQEWHTSERDSAYSQRCNKMFTIIDDKVGQNTFGGGFCTADLNYARYGVWGTRNCGDNLAMAIAPYGLTRRDLNQDGTCALMMNLAADPDGGFVIRESEKQPGRYVDLLAEMDLLLAISACPQELNPCNAFHPTPVKVVVYEKS